MARRATSAQVPRSGATGAARAAAIEIRPLHGIEEYQACMDLQRETWGDAPGTLVPTPLLIVAQRIGGVAAGAFDASGTLLGFVFGLTGVEHGELVHWSDMLAVRPEARDRGLGRLLKEYQRKEMGRLGVRTIYWTYDPLVAKNAYLNLIVLGARVAEYVVDMYGDTGSPMHAGIGTDRIVVAWPVRTEPSRAAKDVDSGAAPASAPADGAEPPCTDADDWTALNPDGARFIAPVGRPERVTIEIPPDVFAVREQFPDAAKEWRRSSREAFQWALAEGYAVTGLERLALGADSLRSDRSDRSDRPAVTGDEAEHRVIRTVRYLLERPEGGAPG